MIDEDIVDEYLRFTNCSELDKSKYIVISINKTFDKSRFDKIENQRSELPSYPNLSHQQWYWDNNRKKLVKE